MTMPMTMTMKIVYFDTILELIISKSITKEKICAKEIPLWAGILVVIIGPPKGKENNQNILLSVIFKQTVQGVQCIEHIL